MTLAVQHEIEELYRQPYGHEIENSDEIAVVFIGICDDQSRFAYELGVKCDIQLALDLELDRTFQIACSKNDRVPRKGLCRNLFRTGDY